MAKVKKSEKTAAVKMEKNDEPKSPGILKSPKAEKIVTAKPKSNIKSGAKGVTSTKMARQHPPYSEMVSAALSTMKNRKGHTLVAIRKYIAQHYDCGDNKTSQLNIKKYLMKEFTSGTIKMVNNDDDEIKFNQRFALNN